jgi:NDP-sugar pyrophosphorylase family protein
VVLLVGYLGNIIEEYFSIPRVPDLQVECVHEESSLGRGGAFKKGYQIAGQGNALVIATNGDVLTDQSLSPMLELHASSNALATVMVTPMLSPYGVVDVDGGSKVTGFREKPTLPFWINAGVYVFSAEVMDRFPDVGDHEAEVFPALAIEGRIAAYRSEAYWKSVETAKDLREAEEFLVNHETFNQGATA